LIQDIEKQRQEQFRVPKNFSPYKASWFAEFFYLFIRGMQNYYRNIRLIISDFFMAAVREVIFRGILLFTRHLSVYKFYSFQRYSEA
jgi:hypothetical protein